MNNFFVSICIPAYNRPEKLGNLLATIDGKNSGEIEIVICEDVSPKREKNAWWMGLHKRQHRWYTMKMKNLDYDGICGIGTARHGEWLVLWVMTRIYSGALDKLIFFIKIIMSCLMLRRYCVRMGCRRLVIPVIDFEPGKTYEELFRKVFYFWVYDKRIDLLWPIDDFDGLNADILGRELLLVERRHILTNNKTD
jgi:hypothetical protein